MPASDAIPTPATPVRCTERGAAGSSGRGGGADGEVMDLWAKLADQLVVTRWMHAVREHDHVEIAVEIDPERRAGEADVADGIPGKLRSGGRSLERRGIPAERPRGRPD